MDVVQEHMTTLQFIESREGAFKAQHHESEKTIIELMNYFDAHYKVFSDETPANDIIEYALDCMGEHDFVAMLSNHEFTDIMEMLKMEGFITTIGSYYLISIDFPLQGFLEE